MRSFWDFAFSKDNSIASSIFRLLNSDIMRINHYFKEKVFNISQPELEFVSLSFERFVNSTLLRGTRVGVFLRWRSNLEILILS